jgi:hypothetical protein
MVAWAPEALVAPELAPAPGSALPVRAWVSERPGVPGREQEQEQAGESMQEEE